MENENFDLDYEIEKAMEKAESIEEYRIYSSSSRKMA